MPGALVMIATPRAGEGFRRAAEGVVVDRAEGIGVADRHATPEPGRAGPRRDVPQCEGAERAGIVQVDVDAHTVASGDAEDDREVAADVAVDPGRVEAADEIRAGRHRRVEQRGRPGITQDAALREGDDLHVDEIAIAVLEAQHRFEARKPDLGIDVDMGAQRARPERCDLFDEATASLLDRERQGSAQLLFAADAFGDGGARRVGDQRQAEQRLVEMDMALDEAGRDEATLAIDRLGGRRGTVAMRVDGVDRIPRDVDVDDPAVAEPGFGEAQRHPPGGVIRHAMRPRRRAATTR